MRCERQAVVQRRDRSQSHRMPSGPWVVAALALVLVIALVCLLAHAPTPARALASWQHDGASECSACHHENPPSFTNCRSCHSDSDLPNKVCTKCHPGKTTTENRTCWSCHDPGEPQPAPTNANCQACHGKVPHLGAQLGDSPGCTTCHGTDPTPHHDGQDYAKPTTCASCHEHADVQSHDDQSCTACHAEDVHPSIPAVPSTCNRCHAASEFGTADCTKCHAGTQPFDGKTDNDIHDETIPDPPISTTTCTSCHGGKQQHAGQVACLKCHPDATPFHHGKASSPGYKACSSCHPNMPQHGAGLACQTCHTNAMHQADPPTPPSSNCNRCHSSSTFGKRNCYNCHDLPVYHAPHAVGPCSSCHGRKPLHAGTVGCTRCHSNPVSGHHVSSVRIPACTSCHSQRNHVGQVSCRRCHGNAAHDRTPLNLPSYVWSVCYKCHPFAKTAEACNKCHDAIQHKRATVPDCRVCHTDKKLHAQKVLCTACHFNIANFHHGGTKPVEFALTCNECHVTAEVHAVDTPAGRSFGCGTCHEGDVHGPMTSPDRKRCEQCHTAAVQHADGLECTQCHWPAVHSAQPKAAQRGAVTPMETVLPLGTGLAVLARPGEEAPPRSVFSNTGLDLAALLTTAMLFIGSGVWLRRREDALLPGSHGKWSDKGGKRDAEED